MRGYRMRQNIGLIAAFASGGLLGAGMALLLAPQSGKKTRQSLTQMGTAVRKESRRLQSDLNRNMDHLFMDIRDDLKSGVNGGENWAREKRSEIERALKSGKRHMEKEMNRIMHS
jgi:gas vesicle protein